MASLRLNQGTMLEVKGGKVSTDGPVVLLTDDKDQIVVAYHLKQGETLRRIEGGKYVVEF